jgi:hypothetical protein
MRGMQCRLWAALLVSLLAGSCASTRAAGPAEVYPRVRALLAQVENTAELLDTVHADPRVLEALGMFLHATDAERLSDEQTAERFTRLVPAPPWEWAPSIEVHKVRSRLYLVALGHAVTTQPSSLYLFDGSSYVAIDSGNLGLVEVEDVHVEGDRIEVAYFPERAGGRPRLTSALVERKGGAWRVDRNTPYRKVAARLEDVSSDEMRERRVHRHPVLLEAFGVFLEHAGRLSDAKLHDHMSALFPLSWYQAWPRFDIRRLAPTLYMTITYPWSDAYSASLYLFDGASYVTLASDDAHWISMGNVHVDDERVEVTYSRSAPPAARTLRSAVAKKEGKTWRVVTDD